MNGRTLLLALAMTATAMPRTAARAESQTGIVELRLPNSPIISFRVVVHTGSVNDPAGKEGLNALTASMIGNGGSESLTYQQIVDRLYPWAASISVQADKEVTTVIGEVHRDHLDAFFKIFWELISRPRFAADDFGRNKEDQLNYLTNSLRGNDDEDLGKEALNAMMYPGHPYRTTTAGTVEGIKAITLDDVKAFHAAMYVRSRITFGIAGGYPASFINTVKASLRKLPEGRNLDVPLPVPHAPEGVEVMIVKKENRATAISFGYPIDVTRSSPDYYALLVANSYLGEHRTFNGVLMNRLRGDRGLNYGDYSYIENFIQEGGSTFPVPDIPRRQQFFSGWIRPVEPSNAQFALRAAIYEIRKVVDSGMTKAQFELTRTFLVNYSKLWVQTQSRRLGYLLDSKFYGTPYIVDEVQRKLAKLTVADVNAAIRKHLQGRNFYVAIVAQDAESLRDSIVANAVSPMHYSGTTPSPAVAAEDRTIEKLPLDVNPGRCVIVPSSDLFEK